eukprot:g4525.t1
MRKVVTNKVKKFATYSGNAMKEKRQSPSLSSLNSDISKAVGVESSDAYNLKCLESDYTISRMIGQGTFATVWEALCKRTGQRYACKSLEKSENPGWRQEVRMCQRVQATSRTKTTKVMTVRDIYETQTEAFIISDLCTGGDLLEWMMRLCTHSRQVYLTELHALKMTRNMLRAAEACHKAGLAHLDLKPENFCFRTADPSSELVLVDFGSAEPFARAPYATESASYDPEMDDEVELSRLIGTAKYMSPEVWEGRFSSRSDVWSVGVILYALLSNQLPFSIEEENTLFAESTTKVTPFLEEQMNQNLWSHVSPKCKTLVRNMLDPTPMNRASATESLQEINDLISLRE